MIQAKNVLITEKDEQISALQSKVDGLNSVIENIRKTQTDEATSPQIQQLQLDNFNLKQTTIKQSQIIKSLNQQLAEAEKEGKLLKQTTEKLRLELGQMSAEMKILNNANGISKVELTRTTGELSEAKLAIRELQQSEASLKQTYKQQLSEKQKIESSLKTVREEQAETQN